MKENLKQALKLTGVLIIIFAIIYTSIISGIALLAPGGGDGVAIEKNGKLIGFENIGQSFRQDKYFWGRPSAVNYNAAGSGASNKAPTNQEYLKTVQSRIDTFLVHNPGITKKEIPSELVTASGSGLDPDISPEAAFIQASRIAKVRNIDVIKIKNLINLHIEKSLLGIFGPEKVNVLKLNIALDSLH
jgi:potassium-transporting ATPase KdpC subunit